MMIIKALYTRCPMWKDVSLPSVYKEVCLYVCTENPGTLSPKKVRSLSKAGAVVFCITDV